MSESECGEFGEIDRIDVWVRVLCKFEGRLIEIKKIEGLDKNEYKN